MAGRGRGRGAKSAPRVPQSLYGRGGATRGGTSGARGGALSAVTAPPSATAGLPEVRDHVVTTGVKRKGFGTSGTAVRVFTNHYEVKIPTSIIHHYDGSCIFGMTYFPLQLTIDPLHCLTSCSW